MPIYTFRNKKSGKEFDEMMSISEMEVYMDNNKHITQVPKGLNIVSGVGGIKHDSGWKENLSRIAEAHPQSTLADTYGKKSVKHIKTQQALTKNKQRIASRSRGKK
jgi:hypothetical protein